MPGAYAEVGAKLVERGFAAIPIIPGSKRPGSRQGGAWVGMTDWRDKYTRRLPTAIETSIWSGTDAGVCVVCGPASRGLCCIDIDVDEQALIDAVNQALPATLVRKAGQKGVTLFFRGDVPSVSFNRLIPGSVTPEQPQGRKERLVDVIGAGRQTVLPPTIHPDTRQPYRWVGAVALEDVDIDDLPELPDDAIERLGDALRPFGWSPEIDPPRPTPGVSATSDDDSPHRRLNDTAMANLDAWVPQLGLFKLSPARGGYVCVATWRASTSGRPLAKRSPNLKIHPSGIVDFHDNERRYTPLDLVMAACGCDLDTAFVQLSRWLGLSPAAPVTLANQARRAHQMEDGTIIDADTGEVLGEAETEAVDEASATSPEIAPAGSAIDAVLAREGLVSDIARWIMSVARRPQPALAVAAGLAVVATIASRQMKTPTHGSLNLYIIMTAASGNGKDAPMKAATSVLHAAGLASLIGPGGAASDVGLFDHVNRSPVSLMAVDEFGDFIAATTGTRAPAHTLKIMATMRQLWDGGLISTSHAVTRNAVTLHDPSLTMLCATTPGQFFDAVGQAQVLNGFLNRFLLFNAPTLAKRRGGGDIYRVPEAIVAQVKALADRPGGLAPSRFRIGAAEDGDMPAAYVVPWGNGAQSIWEAFEDHMLALGAGDRQIEALGARCSFNALRLATVLAVGEDQRDPHVKQEHVELGIELANCSLTDMMAGYNAHLPETQAAGLVDKIRVLIKAFGGTISRRELHRKMQRAFRTSKDLADLMQVMIDTGEVEQFAVTPPAGGTPTVWYRLTKP